MVFPTYILQGGCKYAALGADMYDSVYPTRTARFGVALVPSGVLKLKNICYREDLRCCPLTCRAACYRYMATLLL